MVIFQHCCARLNALSASGHALDFSSLASNSSSRLHGLLETSFAQVSCVREDSVRYFSIIVEAFDL
jgi:hypothetical protein